MIVVADMTPLSELAKIGEFYLLQKVYGQLVIPREVYKPEFGVRSSEFGVMIFSSGYIKK